MPAIANRPVLFRLTSVFLLACTLAAMSQASDAAEPTHSAQDRPVRDSGIEFFERKIRPVLIQHCYECHAQSADDIGGGLLVDSRSGMLTGGETGAAVVPGNVEQSVLMSALEYGDFEMPPDQQLPESVIEDFRRWIEMGAPDPRDQKQPMVAGTEADGAGEQSLWSLTPVQNPSIPHVEAVDWPRQSIDFYVLAEQEQRGLEPVADAEPLAWLRRVSFDLVGLPPAVEDVADFANNPLPATYAALVDRLLASRQFGERWARHWFDVVRYGESAGSSRDVLMIYAWRYRDYVIDALNDDVPYDRFIVEQIAGDLIPAESSADRDRLNIATGLLAIGSKSLNGGNLELDIIDDQIDVISKAVMGLTVSCARCHDHKFDPIATADYYSLAGIFQSTETFYGGSTRRPKNLADRLKVYLPLGEDSSARAQTYAELTDEIGELQDQQKALQKEVNGLKRSLPDGWQARHATLIETGPDGSSGSSAIQEQPHSLKDQEFLAQIANYQNKLKRLEQIEAELAPLRQRQSELPQLEFYLGVRDAAKIGDCAIRIRGDKNQRGELAPRGFLSQVHVDSPPVISGQRSGRRELADWLTRADHPLTPRVVVNRVWQHLFGRGIVGTVDNFGRSGLEPTHPELLDHLAHRLVHVHRWSVKSLIRELALSRTYQLASESHAGNAQIDEANVYHWRYNRWRLQAEALRDAMLVASGQVDLNRPYGSAVYEVGEGEVGRNLKTAPLDVPRRWRSVYLPVIRGLVPEVLRVFDFPDPSNPQGVRDETNVPAQSLYLMNSPFVISQAEAMANQLLAAQIDDGGRIDWAYRLAFTRPVGKLELSSAEAFLSKTKEQLPELPAAEREHFVWATFCQALFSSVEFRYVD